MMDTDKPILAIVCGEPAEISAVDAAFGRLYQVRVFTDAPTFIADISNINAKLVIAGEQPNSLSNLAFCTQIKPIPVFLLLNTDNDDEGVAFAAGATDTATRPVNAANFVARIQHQLQVLDNQDGLNCEYQTLLDKVNKHSRLLEEMQDVSMVAMGSLAETRDPETGNHIRRTQRYVKVLAEALKTHPKFASFLTDDVIASLYKSAPLHDIGKIGIPDHILLKPGSLTFDEFEVMKKHTLFGRDAIVAAERNMTENEDFLSFAREIAYSHHEMWNGQGYPLGLAGEDIPIAARLMSIADVYDALISRRVYKSATSHEAAVSMIVKSRGIQFDPDMIDVFLTITDQYQKIAEEFSYTYREKATKN